MITRRDFVNGSLLAFFSGVTITIAGCGKYNAAGMQGPGAGDVAGDVLANHGHVAIVTAAELQAGGAVQLNIQGQADHNHVVTLSSAQVQAIAQQQQVSVISSIGLSHNHQVIFN